jgi:hypothetical protein
LIYSIKRSQTTGGRLDGYALYELIVEQRGQDVVITGGIINVSYDLLKRVDVSTEEEIELGSIRDGKYTGSKETNLCYLDYDEDEIVKIPEDKLCSDHPEVCHDCNGDGVNECYWSCEHCGNWVDRDDCEEFPFFCTDCDDDGVPECFSGCDYARYYEYVDKSVEPGRYRYTLKVESFSAGDRKTVEIDVVDNDDGGVADNDDGNSHGCQVVVAQQAKRPMTVIFSILQLLLNYS